MHHRRHSWLALAVSLLLACSARDGEITVVLEGPAPRGELEVLAIAADPASLLDTSRAAAGAQPAEASVQDVRDTAPLSRSASADSVARYRTLADSAAALDAAFQRERLALNSDARALESVDRLTPEYAARHDSFRLRELAAERIRAARDRLRVRASALEQRLGPRVAAAPAEGTAGEPDLHALRERARDAEVDTRIAPVREGSATLALPPGRWWIGVAPTGSAPVSFVAIRTTAGARDTVRLSAQQARGESISPRAQ